MDPSELEVGELVTETFLVAEAKLGVDKRGQNYYSLVLNYDGGRRVEGKVWADNIGAALKAGQGVEVLARVDEYMGRLQLNVQRYRILDPEEFDASLYVRSTDIDVGAAFEELFNWERDEFENPFFKRLMWELHENSEFSRQFKTSPAASVHHHNYMGGLLEHTLDVWNLAAGLSQHYEERFDRDLLLCGAALHDVGKVKSYDLVSGVSQPTEAGLLLNHVFISASMVSNLWDRVLSQEVTEAQTPRATRYKQLLLHIILSHHGRREWGSPVLPQTPEALLIHCCDQLSATMRSSFDALGTRPEGEPWTDWVSIMDERRRLFLPRDMGPQDEG